MAVASKEGQHILPLEIRLNPVPCCYLGLSRELCGFEAELNYYSKRETIERAKVTFVFKVLTSHSVYFC